jgi:hypothetical protein
MRVFYIIVFLITLLSCTKNKGKQGITLEYKANNIFINYNGNKDYIKIPFIPEEQLNEKNPAYCIDTLNNTIFTFVPGFGIKNYDLSSKRLIKDCLLEYKYHKRNHSFQLRILNDYIVFSSYSRVLIFNKNLELKANLRDTIERNLCPELALHKYEIEYIGDTLLFKALFVEKSDFESNKRHKRILKDYEFVIKDGSIMCNNCDKCKSKNNLTKMEMDQLLNNSY